mmetsp:Transcript_2874/g.10084  ORF Transcript_2874/g.10084 Transcript_2874/m.10084 type:complete len:196 (-) Transcript_2874:150-737(-)
MKGFAFVMVLSLFCVAYAEADTISAYEYLMLGPFEADCSVQYSIETTNDSEMNVCATTSEYLGYSPAYCNPECSCLATKSCSVDCTAIEDMYLVITTNNLVEDAEYTFSYVECIEYAYGILLVIILSIGCCCMLCVCGCVAIGMVCCGGGAVCHKLMSGNSAAQLPAQAGSALELQEYDDFEGGPSLDAQPTLDA